MTPATRACGRSTPSTGTCGSGAITTARTAPRSRTTAARFTTLAGPAPVGGSYVDGGITGTFDGGYVTTQIVGKFTPRYPTHGNLGTFDAKCDLDFNCPGKRPSWLSYFTKPVANEFAFWGWLYDAGAHGTWLDQANVSPPDGGSIR